MHVTKALALSLVLSVPALADEATQGPPAEVARYRQSAMKAGGAHLKALALVTGKGLKVSQRQLAMHAQALVELAELTPELFPAGTGPAEAKDATEAKAAVWKEPAKFKQAAEDMLARARAVQDAAGKGDMDALKKAVEQANDGCSSCHKAFKERR